MELFMHLYAVIYVVKAYLGRVEQPDYMADPAVAAYFARLTLDTDHDTP